MADLIDRQAALEALYSVDEYNSRSVMAIKQLPSAEPEAISKWKKEFREYVDSLDIARDDWKGIIEYIDELPSAQPDVIRCKDCVNYIDNRCVVANHHVAPFSCCQDVFNARRRGEQDG
jgi:hypothetical protein